MAQMWRHKIVYNTQFFRWNVIFDCGEIILLYLVNYNLTVMNVIKVKLNGEYLLTLYKFLIICN